MVRGVGEQFRFTSFPEKVEIGESCLKIFRAKPGDIVIDTGACCGLTAYQFSRAVGSAGRVLAIEADPRDFECLAGNVTRLQAQNIDVLHAMVWQSSGRM